MRTTAIVLGVLGACLILAFGYFLYATSFGTLEQKIPGYWQLVYLTASLAMAGAVATWWRGRLGAVLMAASVAGWLLLDWQMIQALNLFNSAGRTIHALVFLLSPVLLLGLAIYLALKNQGASAQNPS